MMGKLDSAPLTEGVCVGRTITSLDDRLAKKFPHRLVCSVFDCFSKIRQGNNRTRKFTQKPRRFA